jgi:threonine/homoserine/homoserine lactone efflux protein
MNSWLFIKSLFIGIAVAAPVGPMSLLCIQRTVQRGQPAALAFGAGVAAADGTYAAVAAFGITAISAALLAATGPIKLVGSLILLYMGFRIACSRPGAVTGVMVADSDWRAFVAAYGLTITNPPTILFFASVFASLASFSSFSQSVVFSAGVFLGSMFWWLLLTTLVARLANSLTSPVLLFINRLSGAALVGFGLYGLVQLSVT